MAIITTPIQIKYTKVVGEEKRPPIGAEYVDISDIVSEISEEYLEKVYEKEKQEFFGFMNYMPEDKKLLPHIVIKRKIQITFISDEYMINKINAMKKAANGSSEKGVLWFLYVHSKLPKDYNTIFFKAKMGEIKLPIIKCEDVYRFICEFEVLSSINWYIADPEKHIKGANRPQIQYAFSTGNYKEDYKKTTDITNYIIEFPTIELNNNEIFLYETINVDGDLTRVYGEGLSDCNSEFCIKFNAGNKEGFSAMTEMINKEIEFGKRRKFYFYISDGINNVFVFEGIISGCKTFLGEVYISLTKIIGWVNLDEE